MFQDRDNANAFGAAIDEFIAHQPSVKPLVMESIMRSLDEIQQMGRTFELPQDAKARAAYGLLPVGDAAADEAAAADISVGSAGGRSVALADVVTDEPDPIRKEDITKLESNPVIASIDVVAAFWRASSRPRRTARSSSRWTASTSFSASTRFLVFRTTFPCRCSPIRSSPRPLDGGNQSQHCPHCAAPRCQSCLGGSDDPLRIADKSFSSLTYDNTVSRLLWMATPRDDAEAEQANLAFRKLVGLCSRTHLFTDVCTITYVGHKLPSIFLQTLVASAISGTVSIAELGAIHRAGAWRTCCSRLRCSPAASLRDAQSRHGQQDGRCSASGFPTANCSRCR